MEKMNLVQVKDLFRDLASQMIACKDLLTQADQAIGDGDHGIGMARGFEAVRSMLEEKSLPYIEDIFCSVGLTLLSSIGGASGAIFGSFFIGASKGLKGVDYLDAKSFTRALTSGLEMVKMRGNAKIGDKTMVDALEPAVMAANNYTRQSLEELAGLVHQAAEEGMNNTKNFVAKIGKAKTLGERTLGFADPGAISITLIFQFVRDFIIKL